MSAAASADGTALRDAYIEACLGELRALKPGNVHIHGAGHGMTVADFETSARVSAGPLTRSGLLVGQRIRDAVAATRATVGCNTNLGIILLAAPLLVAAEMARPGGLRSTLEEVLTGLTRADAVAAYEAIRLAAPAGLGSVAEQDAAETPSVDLRQAMALAAGRDSIARQYATFYADVFAIGVARLQDDSPGNTGGWAITRAYMEFLAAFPDSHVLRKHGTRTAEDVRAEAATLLRDYPLGEASEDWRTALLDFDRRLKARGLNPGSSADLTVASLLAVACENILSRNQEKQDGPDGPV